METIKQVMKEKISILNKAAKSYYVDGREIMSNFEYDKLYDELETLEKESGIILAGSPTQNVGYEVLSELPKEAHPSKMLSLDKTKDREQLRTWLKDQRGLLSWKLDGLTIVLTYEEGHLVKAVTRGNGEIGEVITNNAKTFVNLPLKIGYNGPVTLRGEAVISYEDFEKINEEIPEVSAKYKNPRNLCSGSVRQLNNQITAERRVRFYAFNLVSAEGVDFKNSREEQFVWLKNQGFDVVEYKAVTKENIIEEVEYFEHSIENNPIPSDGLVLVLDDIEYSRSLGTTSKFPKDAIAFKWQDQIAETKLMEIEWSPSRTGLINPVAIFEPVELEGTTVTRASLHNISIMEELQLGLGDEITVYKANMIIPQIAENLTKSGGLEIPTSCPVCHSHTVLKDENGVKTLVCPNPKCLAKQIKSFTLFVSRDAMNVDGLSEMTIEKLIGKGMITEFADIFKLERYKDQFVVMEGFGEKSYENLIASAKKASQTTPSRLLYALGIPGIGVSTAKLIAEHFENKWANIVEATKDQLLEIDGIGEVLADGYVSYFGDADKQQVVAHLINVLTLDESMEEKEDFFKGMTFVITGSLNHFENRDALKKEIEKAGGKVSGSVSSKTSYLVNNNLESTSGKNKKAKDLGIPIINEDTIKEWLDNGGIN